MKNKFYLYMIIYMVSFALIGFVIDLIFNLKIFRYIGLFLGASFGAEKK